MSYFSMKVKISSSKFNYYSFIILAFACSYQISGSYHCKSVSWQVSSNHQHLPQYPCQWLYFIHLDEHIRYLVITRQQVFTILQHLPQYCCWWFYFINLHVHIICLVAITGYWVTHVSSNLSTILSIAANDYISFNSICATDVWCLLLVTANISQAPASSLASLPMILFH